jgi:hypothetical protein
MAQKTDVWAEHIEESLKLPKNTYKKTKKGEYPRGHRRK